MVKFFEHILDYVIVGVEAAGVMVIVLSVGRTVIRYVVNFFRPEAVDIPTLRLSLGQSMVMALEFQVAADILRTALSPAWTDIMQLAVLIGLRTLLNYLLEQELEHLSSVCDLMDVT
jgi:uncharacterized membrane protein